MNPERSIEATGDDVEAAIANGLAELGVGPTEVIVEVLEEPSRGMFGLGSRRRVSGCNCWSRRLRHSLRQRKYLSQLLTRLTTKKMIITPSRAKSMRGRWTKMPR
jgi:predicted RNA-binding protein Jag